MGIIFNNSRNNSKFLRVFKVLISIDKVIIMLKKFFIKLINCKFILFFWICICCENIMDMYLVKLVIIYRFLGF